MNLYFPINKMLLSYQKKNLCRAIYKNFLESYEVILKTRMFLLIRLFLERWSMELIGNDQKGIFLFLIQSFNVLKGKCLHFDDKDNFS